MSLTLQAYLSLATSHYVFIHLQPEKEASGSWVSLLFNASTITFNVSLVKLGGYLLSNFVSKFYEFCSGRRSITLARVKAS